MLECFVHQIGDFQPLSPFLVVYEGLAPRVVVGHLDLVPPLGFSQIQLAQIELAAFLVAFQERKLMDGQHSPG